MLNRRKKLRAKK